MKKQHFQYTTLSFVFINIWTLYSFFDFYDSHSNHSMGSLTLFFNFLGSVVLATGIGILLIFMRIIFFRKKNKFKLKNNFFYIFTGLFNLNLSIIWLVSIVMNFINLQIEGIYYFLGNVISTGFILVDIYAFQEKTKIEKLENGNEIIVE